MIQLKLKKGDIVKAFAFERVLIICDIIMFKLQICIENAIPGIIQKLDNNIVNSNKSGEYILNIEHGEHKLNIISDSRFLLSLPKPILYKNDKYNDSVSFARVKYDINSLYYEFHFSTNLKFNVGEINLKLDKTKFFNYSGGFSEKLDITLIRLKRIKLKKERKQYFIKYKMILFFLTNFFIQTVIHGLFFLIPFEAFIYCIANKNEITAMRSGIPNKYYIILFGGICLIIFFIWLFNIVRLIKEIICNNHTDNMSL